MDAEGNQTHDDKNHDERIARDESHDGASPLEGGSHDRRNIRKDTCQSHRFQSVYTYLPIFNIDLIKPAIRTKIKIPTNHMIGSARRKSHTMSNIALQKLTKLCIAHSSET